MEITKTTSHHKSLGHPQKARPCSSDRPPITAVPAEPVKRVSPGHRFCIELLQRNEEVEGQKRASRHICGANMSDVKLGFLMAYT